MSMRYWKVEMTCTTPVHIGSGETYSKNSYIYDRYNQDVYFLNEGKWAGYLHSKGLLDRFALAVERDYKFLSIYDWLKENALRGGTMPGLLGTLKASGVVSPAVHVEADKNERLNDVKAFIRNGAGDYYIPGSSIKGAMRTAILSHAVREEPGKYRGYWSEISERPYKSNISKKMDELEKELAIPLKNGKRDMVNSYFRGLSVSDAEIKECRMAVVKKWDLGERAAAQDEDPRGLPIFRESLVDFSTATFTVGIDADLMGVLGVKDWTSLLAVLREFSAFQCGLLAPVYKDWRKGIWSDMTSADLVLGGGAGFLSKTLLYSLAPDTKSGVAVVKKLLAEEFGNSRQPDKHRHMNDRRISPHTLKLTEWNGAGKYYIMGLCRLEAEELKC